MQVVVVVWAVEVHHQEGRCCCTCTSCEAGGAVHVHCCMKACTQIALTDVSLHPRCLSSAPRHSQDCRNRAKHVPTDPSAPVFVAVSVFAASCCSRGICQMYQHMHAAIH